MVTNITEDFILDRFRSFLSISRYKDLTLGQFTKKIREGDSELVCSFEYKRCGFRVYFMRMYDKTGFYHDTLIYCRSSQILFKIEDNLKNFQLIAYILMKFNNVKIYGRFKVPSKKKGDNLNG